MRSERSLGPPAWTGGSGRHPPGDREHSQPHLAAGGGQRLRPSGGEPSTERARSRYAESSRYRPLVGQVAPSSTRTGFSAPGNSTTRRIPAPCHCAGDGTAATSCTTPTAPQYVTAPRGAGEPADPGAPALEVSVAGCAAPRASTTAATSAPRSQFAPSAPESLASRRRPPTRGAFVTAPARSLIAIITVSGSTTLSVAARVGFVW